MAKHLDRRTEKARPKSETSDEGMIAHVFHWPVTRRHINPDAEGHKVAREGAEVFRKALRSEVTESA